MHHLDQLPRVDSGINLHGAIPLYNLHAKVQGILGKKQQEKKKKQHRNDQFSDQSTSLSFPAYEVLQNPNNSCRTGTPDSQDLVATSTFSPNPLPVEGGQIPLCTQAPTEHVAIKTPHSSTVTVRSVAVMRGSQEMMYFHMTKS